MEPNIMIEHNTSITTCEELTGDFIELAYTKKLEEFIDLKDSIHERLMILRDHLNMFSVYTDKFRDALYTFGIKKNTPISKEIGDLIMKELVNNLEPILLDILAIYVKVDGGDN